MSNGCLDEILKLINNSKDGGISVADYMSLCLSHPEHGYYMNCNPFGAEGDFVTSPEISQIFGDVIGGFFVQNWVRMGRPDVFSLVELGPGRGTLMSDIWRTAEKALPEFCKAANVHLVEISQTLREKQQHVLSDIENIKWHNSFSEIPSDKPFFLLGNEFFDALPIRQFILGKDGWRERLVGWDEENSELIWKQSSKTYDISAPINAKIDDIYEFCPAAEEVMRDICQRLKQQKGMAIFIDYGYVADSLGDTLQAVYKHEYSNILSRTGKQDLTAHVDFSTLKKIAKEEGVSVTGSITQAEFLKALGADKYTEGLCKKATPEQEKTLKAAYHRLTSAFEMGYLFKVLGVSY